MFYGLLGSVHLGMVHCCLTTNGWDLKPKSFTKIFGFDFGKKVKFSQILILVKTDFDFDFGKKIDFG